MIAFGDRHAERDSVDVAVDEVCGVDGVQRAAEAEVRAVSGDEVEVGQGGVAGAHRAAEEPGRCRFGEIDGPVRGGHLAGVAGRIHRSDVEGVHSCGDPGVLQRGRAGDPVGRRGGVQAALQLRGAVQVVDHEVGGLLVGDSGRPGQERGPRRGGGVHRPDRRGRLSDVARSIKCRDRHRVHAVSHPGDPVGASAGDPRHAVQGAQEGRGPGRREGEAGDGAGGRAPRPNQLHVLRCRDVDDPRHRHVAADHAVHISGLNDDGVSTLRERSGHCPGAGARHRRGRVEAAGVGVSRGVGVGEGDDRARRSGRAGHRCNGRCTRGRGVHRPGDDAGPRPVGAAEPALEDEGMGSIEQPGVRLGRRTGRRRAAIQGAGVGGAIDLRPAERRRTRGARIGGLLSQHDRQSRLRRRRRRRRTADTGSQQADDNGHHRLGQTDQIHNVCPSGNAAEVHERTLGGAPRTLTSARQPGTEELEPQQVKKYPSGVSHQATTSNPTASKSAVTAEPSHIFDGLGVLCRSCGRDKESRRGRSTFCSAGVPAGTFAGGARDTST